MASQRTDALLHVSQPQLDRILGALAVLGIIGTDRLKSSECLYCACDDFVRVGLIKRQGLLPFWGR
jgi:hypothetical protein